MTVELDLPFDSLFVDLRDKKIYLCLEGTRLVFLDLPGEDADGTPLSHFTVGGFQGVTKIKVKKEEGEDGRLQETES